MRENAKCYHCGAHTEAYKIGGKWFCICTSEACRPEGRGIGRPCSSGKATADEAIDDGWAEYNKAHEGR